MTRHSFRRRRRRITSSITESRWLPSTPRTRERSPPRCSRRRRPRPSSAAWSRRWSRNREGRLSSPVSWPGWRGWAPARGGGAPRVPAVIERRLDALGPSAGALLDLVAVAGGPIAADFVLDLAGLGPGGR